MQDSYEKDGNYFCSGCGSIKDYSDDECDCKGKPHLQLSGEDGNAFSILGRARKVAVKYNLDWKQIEKEATGGDYDYLLQTMMKYFEVG